MFLSTLYSWIVFLAFTCSINNAYDVVIYGATPGGIAAAITAARTSSSLSVVIIEPTSYIGGMAAPGGIGLRDLALEDSSKFIIVLLFMFLLASFFLN